MQTSPWPEVSIGEFAWEVNEQPDRADVEVLSVTKHEGFVPSLQYFGKQVFSKDTSKYKLVRRGQFAYATIHLDEGSIDSLRIRDSGVISPMYTVFDIDTERVDGKFLLDLLSSPMMVRRYGGIGQGSVNRRKSIGFDTLALEKVSLPPLVEQKKIAAILSSVDEAIQATEAVIEQTRRIKQGLLQELLTRGIGHTRFKATRAGEIPEHWGVATPGDLATFTGGYGFRPPDWSSQGLPIIRIQNLNGNPKFNYYDGPTREAWIVEPGDLLFAWAGSAGASFGPCIWPGPRGVLNQHIYKLHVKPGVDGRWLYAVMRLITARIEQRAHGFKTTLLHVHKSDITDQPIPLPPDSEQRAIAERLGNITSTLEANESKLVQLQQVKAGLLQDLLTGKVRVST